MTADLLHSNMGEGLYVYDDMPKGCKHYSKSGRKKFLKLKTDYIVYVRLHVPFDSTWLRSWSCVPFKQSEFDPCLFVWDKVIYILYVYDIILWAMNDDAIHDLEI